MRIHSDFIEEMDVRKAARLAGVQFTRFGLHGSRKREHAFDVILTGSSPRRQNQGEDYAATWDEWGSFLGYLFALDANAWTQQYTSGAHFDWATDGQYRNGVLPVRHASHRWEYAGGMASECQCGAVRRWASDFDGAAA